MSDSESFLMSVFEELRLNLGPAISAFERKEDASITGGGIILSLTPRNIKAATIVAHADKRFDVFDLILGKNTSLEVPVDGGRYTRYEGPNEMRALCLGVISGNFREDLWIQANQIVKSLGIITVEGHDVRVYSGTLLLNPFKKRSREHVSYQPY